MNERLFLSARLQFMAIWGITILTPVAVILLTNQIVPENSIFSLPLWLAIIVGLVISFGIHLILRKTLRNAHLFGSAIYNEYQRDRKSVPNEDFTDHTEPIS